MSLSPSLSLSLSFLSLSVSSPPCKASPSHLWNVETLCLSWVQIPSPPSSWGQEANGQAVGGEGLEGEERARRRRRVVVVAAVVLVMGGDQLTDVVPRVQEPCLFSAGELEEGPGLGAGREISGSCLQVQIPPLCVSVWRRSSPEPLPSPLKIRWWYRVPFGTSLTDGLCVTHMPLSLLEPAAKTPMVCTETNRLYGHRSN